MASTQKKTTNSKGSSKGKADPKKSGGKKAASKRKKLVYAPNMQARGIGAAVCAFLAVMLFLGMFGAHAVVVDFLYDGVKGLIGYGAVTAPFALVAAALFLLLQRDKSVQVRLWCLGFYPLFLGAFVHLIHSPYTYQMALSSCLSLWRDGVHLYSGGVLGGMLSISFQAWFSSVGAGILLALVMLALLAGIFRVTPAVLFSFLRARRAKRAAHRREREAYEEYEDYDDYEDDYADEPFYEEELPPPARPSVPFWSRVMNREPARKKAADLPLDEPEETLPPVQTAPVAPAVPPLVREEQETADLPDDAADVIGFDDPLPEDLPPQETKAQRQEAIRQETGKVTQAVAQTLEEPPRDYQYPPLDILTPPSGEAQQAANEELEGTMGRLASVLNSFGIDGHVTGAVQGPSVTRYEVALEQGVRLNKLTNLSDDVALALGVSNVRIAPVPGKISVVGVEVPNQVVIPVPIREVLDSDNFRRHKSSAAFSVGKDIGGNYIVGDCAKLPHMLIAGTTGSGKSVCINSLIVSMLYKSTPEELRLIMVDPKMVELGGYNGIPHLLIPVVTDPKKAAGALQWAVTEMMKRYRLFAEAGVRELTSYNQWAKTQENVAPMPKVVIVIDELADLMLVAAKEVEESICRVAQMGRASGMHLVIATQRPSADVITGLMKANIPSRVAFAVASSLESRIILDTTGAEKLVGKGDMLWFPLGSAKPLRVQGCFISDEEVASVVASVKQNSTADYDDAVLEQIEQHVSESEKKGKGSGGGGYPGGDGGEEQDELFPAAVDVILELGQASVSMLQRRLKLGYARAARLVDQMEQKGIVGPFEGSKPRQLLITKEQWQQMQHGGEVGDAPPVAAEPPVEEEILTFDPVPQQYEGP